MRQWFKYWHVHGLGKKEKQRGRLQNKKVTRERGKGRKGKRGNKG